MKYVVKLHMTTNPRARKWYYLSSDEETVLKSTLGCKKFDSKEEAEEAAARNSAFGAVVEKYEPKPMKVEEIGFSEDGKAFVKSSKTVMM